MPEELVKTGMTDVVASLVLHGDMSKLNPAEQVKYYNSMCERIGLDPLSQPFQILKTDGKQRLYCNRSGAAQLNKIHKVSHQRTHSETVGDVFFVYMKASTPDGRFTESCGAVSITGLKGDALANAVMKAETKAKRRATMDLLGLGMLDETEIATIPDARVVDFNPAAEHQVDPRAALLAASAEKRDKALANLKVSNFGEIEAILKHSKKLVGEGTLTANDGHAIEDAADVRQRELEGAR